MNKNAEKRIIAFTSQSLKEYGIHAVRMDDIARNMGMSKRTIYQNYTTKENLIYTCLQDYRSRIMDMFRVVRYDFLDIVEYL
ncbi:TetR/AcrR family transcriptional regulator [Bacteroides salyersiae]|uniref:TetR/AcrR family transcriptional regulator n=1 Tax=Bacteroides salyersiae TaxID=291644 RepID=UPI001E5351D0|nr:TetR/AcrR family transcriptional regulator [Bacteroides salyersiae]